MGIKPSPVYRVLPLTAIPHYGKSLFESMTNRGTGQETKFEKRKSKEEITLYLKNGGEITGELLSEEGDWITLGISGSEAGFHASEIARMVRKDRMPDAK